MTTAILAGAGGGVRLGAGMPKALVTLKGIPLVAIAAKNLAESGAVDQIIVTSPPGREADFQEALREIPLPVIVVSGGETRQLSVSEALAKLDPATEVVLVHDAARPFASPDLIRRSVVAISAGATAVVPGLPVSDTIKRVRYYDDDAGSPVRVVEETPDRAELVAVQTPQAFDRQVLERAYQNAAASGITATDDAGLVEALGERVVVIPGEAEARKITTPADLARLMP